MWLENWTHKPRITLPEERNMILCCNVQESLCRRREEEKEDTQAALVRIALVALMLV